ncbi:cyclic nucleotide-binding domain-containing protein [Candidatus Reidiella endopervernicosa]
MAAYAMELKPSEQRVLSDIFPSVAEVPGLSDYAWNKQAFKSGDVLFKPGQPCNRFVLLGHGTIRVQLQNDQGRNLLLYRIEPGQLCIHSLINLINDQNFSYITSADSDGWLCWAERSSFRSGWIAPRLSTLDL